MKTTGIVLALVLVWGSGYVTGVMRADGAAERRLVREVEVFDRQIQQMKGSINMLVRVCR